MSDPSVFIAPLSATSLGDMIPWSSLEFGDTLNSAGSASIEVPTDSLPAGVDLSPAITAVYVIADGVVLFAGPIWTLKDDLAGRKLTLGCQGMLSVLAHRTIDVDLNYVGVDQLTIFDDLMAAALPPATFLPWSSGGSGTSGIARTQSYSGYQHTAADQAISQLAATFDGFDYATTTTLSGTTVTTSVRAYYPRLGSVSGYLLDQDSNVMSASVTIDGTTFATVCWVTGSGTGNVQVNAVATKTFGPAAPGLTLVASDTLITDQGACQQAADLMLTQQGTLVAIPELKLRPDDVPALGSYGVGDDVVVNLPGAHQPIEYVSYRIQAWSARYSATEREVTLTLAPTASFPI